MRQILFKKRSYLFEAVSYSGLHYKVEEKLCLYLRSYFLFYQKRPMISVTMTASCLLLVAAIAGTIVVLNVLVHHSDGAPTSALQLEGRGRGYNAQEYMAARHRLLSKERKRALGAGLVLNAREQRLNKILLAVSKFLKFEMFFFFM